MFCSRCEQTAHGTGCARLGAPARLAATEPDSMDALLEGALQAGEPSLRVMALPDEANTAAYGHPVPAPVRTTPVAGKAILITGHDLKALHDLLVATIGTGIAVYTHGEMLPCHGYPGLHHFSATLRETTPEPGRSSRGSSPRFRDQSFLPPIASCRRAPSTGIAFSPRGWLPPPG